MRPSDSSNGSVAFHAGPPAVAVVVSRYHDGVTSRLLEGARGAYAAAGGDGAGLAVIDSPGSFELVALALADARSGRFAGVVALGCIVRGQTRHDRYLAQAVTNGLVGVTLQTGVPVALGVLTVESLRQAKDRAGGKHGNKGAEAMEALLGTLHATELLTSRRAGSRRRPRSTAAGRGGR